MGRFFKDSVQEQYIEFILSEEFQEENQKKLREQEEIHYLLPVGLIDKVTDIRTAGEEVQIMDFSGADAAGYQVEPKEYACLILLRNMDGKVGIYADRVPDMTAAEPAKILELKAPVINERNRHIKAAAVFEKEGGRNELKFILDLEYLADEEARKPYLLKRPCGKGRDA